MNKAVAIPMPAHVREFLQGVREAVERVVRILRSIFNSSTFKDCVRQLSVYKSEQKRVRQLYYRKKRSQAKRKERRRAS